MSHLFAAIVAVSFSWNVNKGADGCRLDAVGTDGVVAGSYFCSGPAQGLYLRLEAGVYGDKADPPIPVPDDYKVEPVQNFGVDGWRIGPAATRVFGSDRIPDDAHLLRLTVIGPEAERKAVVADLDSAPELAAFKGALLVQEYAPGEWPVAPGFKTSGKPTIYLQAPSGKVLHRQDDYKDGARGLAEAIRKASPDYDAAKDPDLRKASNPFGTGIPLWAWIAGLVGIVFLFKKEGEKK